MVVVHVRVGLLCFYKKQNKFLVCFLISFRINTFNQACRNGLIQHLEHLLFYGADMDAQNASGNTPLHVCAVNNQEACARMLLLRGAQRGALNYANQSAYQVLYNNIFSL